MNLLTMAFFLVLLAALWWWLRLRRASRDEANEESAAARRSSESNNFHAVSIKVGSHACGAAKEMVGRRFLATAAPKLPLPGCNELNCTCKFTHHQDRRANRDRRSPFAPGGFGGSSGAYQSEQRAGNDRRKDD